MAPTAGTHDRETPPAGSNLHRRRVPADGDPGPVGPEQVDAGLLATAKALRRAYDAALGKKLDITLNEANLLAQLAGRRSLTQVDLARHLGVSRARIGVHIDSLEAKAAVRRVADPNDRRVWRVSLTPRGRSMWKQSTDVSSAVRAGVHQGLSGEDLTVLDRLLLVIRENLDGPSGDNGGSDRRP